MYCTPGRSALCSGTRPSPPPTASVYSRPLSSKTMPPGVNGALPIDEQHLLRVGAERGGLRVEAAPERGRLVEHGLRRRAPLVDRALHAFVVPEAALGELGEVVGGELLPGLGAAQAQRRIEQRGLQLQEAGHAGHRRARAAVVEQRAEGGERVAEGVVARHRLHRRPRAAVGRAEHQQTPAVAREQCAARCRASRAPSCARPGRPSSGRRCAPAAGWWRAPRARHRRRRASRRASSSIGRRQSNANGITSWVSARRSISSP